MAPSWMGEEEEAPMELCGTVGFVAAVGWEAAPAWKMGVGGMEGRADGEVSVTFMAAVVWYVLEEDGEEEEASMVLCGVGGRGMDAVAWVSDWAGWNEIQASRVGWMAKGIWSEANLAASSRERNFLWAAERPPRAPCIAQASHVEKIP